MHVDLLDLGHRYSDQSPWLFRGVTAKLAPRTVTGVVGPSGTGKSTLLAILGETVRPARGELVFSEKHSVARVSQASHGVPARMAIDHICLPMLARGDSRVHAEQDAIAIADDFGLGAIIHQPYRQLSGGEAQRLMLARAVAMQANLILADEPTASLDASNALGVIAVLDKLASGGATVALATHDLRAKDVCTAIIDLSEYV